jgi:hypothetical protein
MSKRNLDLRWLPDGERSGRNGPHASTSRPDSHAVPVMRPGVAAILGLSRPISVCPIRSRTKHSSILPLQQIQRRHRSSSARTSIVRCRWPQAKVTWNGCCGWDRACPAMDSMIDAIRIAQHPANSRNAVGTDVVALPADGVAVGDDGVRSVGTGTRAIAHIASRLMARFGPQTQLTGKCRAVLDDFRPASTGRLPRVVGFL